MNPPQNQRRRGRPQSTGDGEDGVPGTAVTPDSDPLATLRAALQDLDAAAFASCFAANAWIRVPRPEGDVVFHGPEEIAQVGYELRDTLGELTWTPSQRFLSAGQVVEEAVVRARKAGDARDEEVRFSMRAISTFDSSGWIASLTLWIDWAALNDPRGVDSARGAASALVAHARAQDARGLRVIKSGPHTSALPLQAIREPAPPPPPNRSVRPAAGVLWWRQHRRTLAGSVMAVLAIGVLGWVAENVLTSPANPNQATADGTLASATTQPSTGSATGVQPVSSSAATVRKADVPVITKEKPSATPTVQAGPSVTFQSDVLFKTNSTDLSATAKIRLKSLAEKVQREALHGTIQINGYTDSRGTVASNLRLSRARATAVAVALQQYLTGSGSDVGLMPQGFGETHPLGSNTTAEGQALNRRVTVVLPKS
jgi:outer membrane protein OmpA-like peptidoglycan-associated protein